MPSVNRVVNPVRHKSKKFISRREPKLIENVKKTLCLTGKHASKIVNGLFKDLMLHVHTRVVVSNLQQIPKYNSKNPNMQIKKQNILPFENIAPIEKFAFKYDTSLFMMGLHNKKRPHNLVMGRMYKHMLLDMVEFGIENYKPLKDFKGTKIAAGFKPLLIFNGELFENNYEYARIKNLLIDMFQKESTENIRLQGLEHVFSFTAIENKILLRSYRVLLKKSNTNTRIPRIELEEIGPRADLLCRRNKLASEDLFKQACKKPKALKEKKKKNISKDTLGTTYGRIHMGAQNINNIQTRKMKGLKKTLSEKKSSLKRRITNNDNEGTKKFKGPIDSNCN